jgi:hypothetical protein
VVTQIAGSYICSRDRFGKNLIETSQKALLLAIRRPINYMAASAVAKDKEILL